jgi:hypothetical protein
MNQLLKTIDITQSRVIRSLISKVEPIYIVGSIRICFYGKENKETYKSKI